ncbi:uncharacterized protein RJT20DRAFT_26763 [Scheffersomyces xylosifermentans]|uniref:uncharacterized protein n=1 Tax=Scheffersomyces xylosifermentans TaxID=1304137 RepID=UPI00315D5471
MRLRLKSRKGIKTVSPDKSDTLRAFVDHIDGLSDLKEEENAWLVDIKVGFPPKPVDLSSGERTIEEAGIRDGEQLILEFSDKPIFKEPVVQNATNGDNNSNKRVLSQSPTPSSAQQVKNSKTETSATSSEEIPSVYIPQLEQHLILRNIPDDNSCMFNSISYALNGYQSYESISPPSQLRSVIVSYIKKSPELYSEVILGRPPTEYCNWIEKKDSWGGAIELGILADWFDIRINCLDIESGNFITFENDSAETKPQKFIVLIYSGVHYDVVAVNRNLSTVDSDKALDVTSWKCGGEDEKLVIEASHKLCKLLQSKNYSTNTTTFRVRCLDCYKVLVGEMGASKHAEETGHFNFGEVK